MSLNPNIKNVENVMNHVAAPLTEKVGKVADEIKTFTEDNFGSIHSLAQAGGIDKKVEDYIKDAASQAKETLMTPTANAGEGCGGGGEGLVDGDSWIENLIEFIFG